MNKFRLYLSISVIVGLVLAWNGRIQHGDVYKCEGVMEKLSYGENGQIKIGEEGLPAILGGDVDETGMVYVLYSSINLVGVYMLILEILIITFSLMIIYNKMFSK